MFRPRSPSARTSRFRPTLEPLEDRTVPSQVGDLLTGFQNQAVIPALTNAINVLDKTRADTAAFQADPHNLTKMLVLAVDGFQLSNAADAAVQQVLSLDIGVSSSESNGLFDAGDANLDATVDLDLKSVTHLEDAAFVALDDFLIATGSLFGLDSVNDLILVPTTGPGLNSFQVPGGTGRHSPPMSALGPADPAA